MPYNDPFDAVAGALYPAGDHNTDVRDNIRWLHDVMLGGDPALINNTDSPYPQGSEDGLIVADTSSGNIQIDLDPVASARPVMVKKVAAANSLTVEPDGAETIDGASNLVLTDGDEFAVLVPDGTEWHVVSRSTASPLGETAGGTGQSTYSQGDILYASAADTLAKLAKGTEGQVLRIGASNVPEWGSVIKSIQRGRTSVGTSTDVTISAVDMSKAVVSFGGSTGTINDSTGTNGSARLTSSTNVRLERGSATGTGYVNWEVVEFY